MITIPLYIPIVLNVVLGLWFFMADKDSDITIIIGWLFAFSLVFSWATYISLLIIWLSH